MLSFLSWYLVITLLAWLTVPLAFRLLPSLPDRGFTLSRALGWLLWGFLFYFFASYHIVQNDLGGVLLALAVLLGLVAWACTGGTLGRCMDWLKAHLGLVVSSELVFLAAFGAWAFVRAANPDIGGTEKPMEIAFLNSIINSPAFPPHDPWLSGYAISYYYFGYVLVSLIIRVTGVATGVAFNLAISLVFGLTALGAYGLVYNLLELWRSHHQEEGSGTSFSLPLLGPLFVLIVSNTEGFLEILHARGLFWDTGFWQKLGILELNQPPATPLTWMPNRPGGTVWWRASRVLADYDFSGNFKEVIDEFPFFSYLLSDLHPHVLAMPFGMLLIGMALNLYLKGAGEGFHILGFRFPFSKPYFLLSAVALGGAAFMNTWDFPVYLALFAGAYTLMRVQSRGWSWSRLVDFLETGILLAIAGVLLYLPFYIGFSSQAGGVLPSVIYFTKGTQLWVMFAPLLIPIFTFLIYLVFKKKNRPAIIDGLFISLGIVAFLWMMSFLFAGVIGQLPNLGSRLLGAIGAGGQSFGAVISASFYGHAAQNGTWLPGRLTAPGAWLTLTILLTLVISTLMVVFQHSGDHLERNPDGNDPIEPTETEMVEVEPRVGEEQLTPRETGEPAIGFWLILVFLGTLLVLGPEFFFLVDQFGDRMNTIFKFYFLAWQLWGISAAFGTAILLQRTRRLKGILLRAGLVVVMIVSLAYPATMLWITTGGFRSPDNWTLDGLAYLHDIQPDDMKAIDWLRSAPGGVVAEAADSKGGEYSYYARIATYSGQPDVIGWAGHESQWGRGPEEMGTRIADLETLYQTTSWQSAQQIIQRYGIRYIVVGDQERSTYTVNTVKFERNLVQAYQSGSVTIFEASALVARNNP